MKIKSVENSAFELKTSKFGYWWMIMVLAFPFFLSLIIFILFFDYSFRGLEFPMTQVYLAIPGIIIPLVLFIYFFMRHSSKANLEFKNDYLIVTNPKLPQFATKTSLNKCEFTLHDWYCHDHDPDGGKWRYFGPLIKIKSPKLDIKVAFRGPNIKWDKSEGILKTSTSHMMNEDDFFKLIKLLGLEESTLL